VPDPGKDLVLGVGYAPDGVDRGGYGGVAGHRSSPSWNDRNPPSPLP
jgi:hypothetical protein